MRTNSRTAARLRLRRHVFGLIAAVPDLDMKKARRAWAATVLVARKMKNAARETVRFVAALYWALLVAPTMPRPRTNRRKSLPPGVPEPAKAPVPEPAALIPETLFSFEVTLPASGLSFENLTGQRTQEGREEKVVRALRLVEQGMSKRAVAKQLGVAVTTSRGWLRKAALVAQGTG